MKDPYVHRGYALSDLGKAFYDMAYAAGWVTCRDWPTWSQSAEGECLLHDRDALANADEEQLAKLLTTIVRSERFCDGAMAQAFDSGLLLAITQRAEVLLRKRKAGAAQTDRV